MIRSSKATAKASRAESKHAESVRRYVMETRDDACRFACLGLGKCDGPDEWMHLGDKRRCFTRKMAPEERHSSKWTCRGCRRHHRMYDAHEFEVWFLDPDKGADGRLMVGKTRPKLPVRYQIGDGM